MEKNYNEKENNLCLEEVEVPHLRHRVFKNGERFIFFWDNFLISCSESDLEMASEDVEGGREWEWRFKGGLVAVRMKKENDIYCRVFKEGNGWNAGELSLPQNSISI